MGKQPTKRQVRELRRLLDRLGGTRDQRAARLGVSWHTVESWELGRRWPRRPTMQLIRLLAGDKA